MCQIKTIFTIYTSFKHYNFCTVYKHNSVFQYKITFMQAKTLISINNINLNYKGKKVLDNINFTLKNNNFITLIGPNGAGKSSLIKIILGLIKPSSGNVDIAKNIRLGYTPQTFKPNIFMPITVINFLKINKKINTSFIHKIASLTGIEHILKQQLKDLSNGELQRILLARALLIKPDILILDEPTQNLDINGQMQFYKLIKDIHNQQNCAVLMVSHDLNRVMRESTQVLCLYHHICCMGKPEQILKNSQFNNLFGKQMNDLTTNYQHQHNHYHN